MRYIDQLQKTKNEITVALMRADTSLFDLQAWLEDKTTPPPTPEQILEIVRRARAELAKIQG